MSTSNFQLRHNGLRWRIKLMQNTPTASLFYCRARDGARDIIRGCHNRDKGTAENERLRDPKFIFSYPKNERLIFLGGSNAIQKEISTMRVG